MTKESNGAGRNTDYKPEYDELVAKICRLGATSKECADVFNCCEKTIYNWRDKYPSFREAMDQAKREKDLEVVQALFQRAVGYEHDDVHISSYEGVITETKIKKHYPPDTKAIQFWLKNRQPDEWRDTTHHELKGSVSVERLEDGRKRARERNKPDD